MRSHRRKILLIAAGLVILLIAAGLVLTWWFFGQPMYKPGDVRTRLDLAPPAQTPQTALWLVEPGVTLKHFSSGSRRSRVSVAPAVARAGATCRNVRIPLLRPARLRQRKRGGPVRRGPSTRISHSTRATIPRAEVAGSPSGPVDKAWWTRPDGMGKSSTSAWAVQEFDAARDGHDRRKSCAGDIE